MEVRALLQVQETPVWSPASAKESNSLETCSMLGLQSCVGVAVFALFLYLLLPVVPGESSRTRPCCHEHALVCMDMLRQVQIYTSHTSLL